MRFPSWVEFTSQLSNLETEITENITKFKEDHPVLDKTIKESLGLLPPPINTVVQNIYNNFDGNEEEKSQEVIQYLKNLEIQGQRHYEKTVTKLDDMLVEIDNTKEINKKQIELIEKILKSSEENQNTILDEFKNVNTKLDDINNNLKEFVEIQEQMNKILQNVPTEIIPNVKIQLAQEYEIKIKKLEDEKIKLQEELKRVGNQPKIDIDLLLKQSFFHYSEGEYEKTAALAEMVLDIEPENVIALNNLGLALDDGMNHFMALQIYNKILTLDPKASYAWNNMGRALDHLGRYEEAIECFDKALEIGQRKDDAWNNKGSILGKLGRYEEAIECFDKALEIKSAADIWKNKGIALSKLKRYEDGIECFDKAIRIKPDYDEAWNNIGAALEELGRYQEAVKNYQKAVEINPFNQLAENNLEELKKKLTES